MNKKLLVLSSISLCSIIFFIVGCTKYNAVLLQEEYSSLQGASISTFFSSWGKPSQFLYNSDGSSTVQWKNIYSETDALALLLPQKAIDKIKKYPSVICELSVDVDTLGKVKNHALLCSQDSYNKAKLPNNAIALAS